MDSTHYAVMKALDRIKVNTDGSFIFNTRRDGIGGIIRDRHGDLIMAFSIPIRCDSNNKAEAIAAEFGGNGVFNMDILISRLNLTR